MFLKLETIQLWLEYWSSVDQNDWWILGMVRTTCALNNLTKCHVELWSCWLLIQCEGWKVLQSFKFKHVFEIIHLPRCEIWIWFNLLVKSTYSWALWDWWSHMEKCDTCQWNYVSDITFWSKFHPVPPISISNFGICKIIELEVKLDIIIYNAQELK
jgi:hypothetical protein